jgi:hypothetical protein
MITYYQNDPLIWPYCTWLDAGADGFDPPGVDSDIAAWKKVYNVAAAVGKTGKIMGENTGGETTAQMAAIFSGSTYGSPMSAVSWALEVGTPIGYQGINWLNYQSLIAGGTNATLANYQTNITGTVVVVGGGSLPLTQTFEEGTNGAAITVSNSFGSGSNAFDGVATAGGSSVYSTAVSAHGSLTGAFSTPASGGTASVYWSNSVGTQTTLYGRIYLNLSAYPAANDAIVEFANAGNFAGGIQISTTGQILTQDATYNNLFAAISTQLIPLNTWVRIEWQLVCGAAGSASLNVKYFATKDSTALTELMTDASGPYGNGSTPAINQVLFGWNTSHVNQPTMYIDDITINNTGYPGPYGTSTNFILSNDFSEGTNGATLTTGNTAGVGENAFDFVTTTNGAAAFSNTQFIHSTLSAAVSTTSTAGQGMFGWTTSFTVPVTTFYGRIYLWLTAAPTTEDANIQIRGTGSSTGGNIQINTSRQIQLQNPSFTQVHTFTNAIPTGQWVRIEWKMVTGVAGAASLTVNYYASADSTTITEGFTESASAWGGTGGVAEVDFGWTNTHASQPLTYFANVQVNNFQFPGPITSGVSGNPPTTQTNAAISVGATTATLYGQTIPNGLATTAHFEYGLTTSYGTIVPVPDAVCGSGNVAVAMTYVLNGLTPGTTYHYRLDATNSAGTTDGSDVTFTTTTVSPVVSTIAATIIGNTTATLNGTVNPEGNSTTYQFQYGLTNSYGSVSPLSAGSAGSGSSPVAVSTSLTGLTAQTTYHYRLNATNTGGTVNGSDQTFVTAAVPVPIFPATPINVLVEILINGAWQDITQWVYERDDIDISGRGRPDETQFTAPSTMTLTINNIGGPFSPNNTTSPFYPYIQSNTQIRISIYCQSSTGVVYNGYRFWGEVRKWPPTWDVTGNDSYVSVVAGSLLTRYVQGANLGSPLKRFYERKTDATSPVAYWPCEELNGASQFSNAENPSGNNMTWSGSPTLSANSNTGGSDPLPQINGAIWTGNTGSYSFNGPVAFTQQGTYFILAPGTVNSMNTAVYGGSGGGANGGNGNGGGGGAYSGYANVGVTPGNNYPVIVGGAGKGGAASNTGFLPGSDGGQSSFAGDSITVAANGGKGATSAGVGLGGTASATAQAAFAGGNGGTGGSGGGGGGGGGAGGPSGNGGNGGNGVAGSGGGGGTAGTTGAGNSGTSGQGGNGGPGQSGVFTGLSGSPGNAPGGGGGGGGWGVSGSKRFAGYNGALGRVALSWNATSTPNNVVVRFVLDVPSTGMPNGAVIARAYISGGTLAGGYMELYYGTGGKVGFRGYTSTSLSFDTSLFAWNLNNVGPVMMSMELLAESPYVLFTMAMVQPNATTYLSQQGTINGTIGSVSQIRVNPLGKIQDTVVGHVLLQYAFEPLLNVAPALGGYNGEIAADRFARMCAEEGFKGTIQGDGYWGFGDGTTQSWTGTVGATVTNTSTSPSVGMNALLVTCSAGATQPTVTSPHTTPCTPGQIVSTSVDIMPTTATIVFQLSMLFYNSSGTLISTVPQPIVNQSSFSNCYPGSFTTLSIKSITAPANTAFVGLQVTNIGQIGGTNATQFILDNASVYMGARMGPQLDESFMDILQGCEDADRGLIVEARDFYGLKYRTRANLQNQTVVATFNYTASQIAAGLQPVFDESLIRNNLSITRTNGSTYNLSLQTGQLSIQTPPAGIGNYPYSLTVNCFSDSQLANMTAWILTVGTVNDYRYPAFPVDMTRPEMATIFAAAPTVDSGDHIQMINAPTDRLPNATVDQLALGFDEAINTFKWSITMQCAPEIEYTGSGFPTW